MKKENILEFFYPFYFPFKQKRWSTNLWWLFLLDYVPVLNLLLLRGWRLELVSRLAREEDNIFPKLKDILRHLIRGSLLWAMTFFYTLIPVFIISSLGLGGLSDLINDIIDLWGIATGTKTDMTFWDWLKGEFWDTLKAMAIESIWVVLSIPLYRAAMIRYSVTGKMRSFINFPSNIKFIVANFKTFLKIYLFAFSSFILATLITFFLLSTVIGSILIPIIAFPIYYWSTGYEYGHLAHKLYNQIYAESA